jgi:hypothetical protein
MPIHAASAPTATPEPEAGREVSPRGNVITEVKDVTDIRRAADRILAQLEADRAWILQRQAETGKADPLRLVCGSSALDRAIDTTCDIIRRLEALDESEAAAGDGLP